MLCNIEEFKEALSKVVNLLNEDVISSKNLSRDEIEPITKNLRKFLVNLQSNMQRNRITNYKELIIFLEKIEIIEKDLIPLNGYLGKILDAIQILKQNTTRSKNAKQYFKNSLQRTAHDFLFNELTNEQKKELFKEILNSVALYILLEISNLAYKNSINPISSLRNSMGNRLPEEYFSELLAGWFIEDVLIEKLREKGFEITQSGIDTNRKILFKRPKGMSESDIIINYKDCNFSIELQRVGKATKPTKINKIKNKNFYKTSLKLHKIHSHNTFIILWFGDNPKGISKSNSFLYTKLCVINNQDICIIKSIDEFKNDCKVFFLKEEIYIHKDYINKNSFQNWEELKEMDFENILKKFNINY